MGKQALKAGWFTEMAYGAVRPTHRVRKLLLNERSQFQDIMIFESASYGRVLVLDGILQVTEMDEFIFHEMMTHVPIIAHGNARRVLIIGGGDGGTLRETLKHNVERVTLIEIDRQVVMRCRQFMPLISRGGFEDKRTNLLICDGAKYLSSTGDKFDIIIVDSTDRLGPGRALYTESFYSNCRRCLTSGGIVVNQNGMPFLYPNHITLTYRRRRKFFGTTSFYLAAVPSFYGGFLAFGWATDRPQSRAPSELSIRRRYVAAKLETKYYTPEIHHACFMLPPFMQKLLR